MLLSIDMRKMLEFQRLQAEALGNTDVERMDKTEQKGRKKGARKKTRAIMPGSLPVLNIMKGGVLVPPIEGVVALPYCRHRTRMSFAVCSCRVLN